ncbi:hypothetical protein [Bradyrhizobium sp. Arg816]|uniref:hypothetical protein n=1 Tax=Bradyrhizobium sp. Arg816 TaxID=2998491 RepID=UPI00249F8BAE|nr:hypothetical protein [Bradyrhizobium sp. Arg816]MDI3567240.1 hypothetical protein [Bradyrhizobium sp. Arg816]
MGRLARRLARRLRFADVAAGGHFFREVTGREPPAKRVKELDVISARRTGKDSVAAAIGSYAAATFRPSGRTRPGERPLVAIFGADRSQARSLLGYIKHLATAMFPATGA